MASDKGLLPMNNSIWAKRAGFKLQLLNIPVVYSINSSQEEAYSAYIQKKDLIVDAGAAEGPLKGVLTTSSQFPGKDFLVLACDMLEIQQDTLQLLTDAYQKGSEDFYAFLVGKFYEPLCAIYRGVGLDKTCWNDPKSNLQRMSLQSILQNGNTKILHPLKGESFRNYNNIEDKLL
jgi:molybdenum cofactor guanylyltransferase